MARNDQKKKKGTGREGGGRRREKERIAKAALGGEFVRLETGLPNKDFSVGARKTNLRFGARQIFCPRQKVRSLPAILTTFLSDLYDLFRRSKKYFAA